MVIIQGREDGAAHMGAHQVMRDSCESRLNLRTVLADAVGIGHKGKNSVKKTPQFSNSWRRKVLFSGLTEMECTVIWGCPPPPPTPSLAGGGYSSKICKIAVARFFLLVVFIPTM